MKSQNKSWIPLKLWNIPPLHSQKLWQFYVLARIQRVDKRLNGTRFIIPPCPNRETEKDRKGTDMKGPLTYLPDTNITALKVTWMPPRCPIVMAVKALGLCRHWGNLDKICLAIFFNCRMAPFCKFKRLSSSESLLHLFNVIHSTGIPRGYSCEPCKGHDFQGSK